MNMHRLAACAALLPALSGHPAAHAAAPSLPATLAGTWGSADSLFDGTTEQLHDGRPGHVGRPSHSISAPSIS